MFQYEDLMWLISFPLVCAVMLWFSLDLAVLVRVGGGRRRRANACRAIERLIMNGAVCATTSVVQSPSLQAARTPASAAAVEHVSPQPGGVHANIDDSDYAARQTDAAPSTPDAHRSPQHCQKVRQIVVPAALRIATRAVVRRAVVMVGGDFARSPRMQYHAASLARSGLFDEVLLVGLDCGNQLSEDLLVSGEPQPERFVTCEGTVKGVEHATYDVQALLSSPEVHAGHGCIVSTRYLVSPPSPPEWFQAVFPLRSLHWVVCTLYRVAALALLFIVQVGRVTATRINEHGQLLVTDLIMVQTPPAVPFVLLVKFIVCPLTFVYNVLLYYCVVVPAAWMHPDAMRDVQRECRLQSIRFSLDRDGEQAVVDSEGKGKRTRRTQRASTPPRLRPWVFYPAIVVDWHNYGYTILRQNQRPTSAVQLYKLLEVHLCAGTVNVTVSRAMKDSLERFYPRLRRRAGGAAATRAADPPETSAHGVTVLYDVAPSFFRPVSRRHCVHEVLDPLLRRKPTSPKPPVPTSSFSVIGSNNTSNAPYILLSMAELESKGWGIAGPPAWVYADAAQESPASPNRSPSSPAAPSANAASAANNGGAAPRRGVMMIGSTSWTEEDDYSVLIRALRRLDHRLNHEVDAYCGNLSSTNGNVTSSSGAAPCSTAPLDLWVLITGKGPARQRFEEAVRVAKLSSHVVVSTYYAQSYQEYSVLLGAADVGICLHYSSSGLDLPMKGVDMVGAGLPVIALQYPAIEELMGGATRVLVQTRAVSSSSSSSSSNGNGNGGSPLRMCAPAALMECERGWTFSGDTSLEVLLSSFVGLPVRETTTPLMNGTQGRGSSSGGPATTTATATTTTTLAPTPLAVMKRKTQEARLHASTWSENWTQVLLPVLKQIV